MQTQVCAQCGIEKRLTAFHRRKDRPQGRHYVCRQCVSDRARLPLMPPELTEAERGYVAGLIDGEGSISLLRASQRGRGYADYHHLQVRVHNTHLGLLEWLKSKLGGAVCRMHAAPTERHKQGYFWVNSTRPGVILLKLLLPYLIIKRRHAEVAIQYLERLWAARATMRERGVRVSSVSDDPVILALVAELSALNRRGPVHPVSPP